VGRKQKFEPVEHPTDNNRQDQIDLNHLPTLRNDGMRSLFPVGWFKISSIAYPFEAASGVIPMRLVFCSH
jgi:hypothetical protein